MQNATERRQEILEYISDRRCLTYQDLADNFDISYNTARRDVEILSCSYPIETVTGNGGGIRAMDGWFYGRRYLNDTQEALLRKLLPGLQPEDQKTMERILLSFGTPYQRKR